jgi:hypothetical protein
MPKLRRVSWMRFVTACGAWVTLRICVPSVTRGIVSSRGWGGEVGVG